ncbi:diguanylate cyclase [Rhodanobacter sp. DHB23]|uniref:diguanylate cyclase domain-containing protein n=1 Tax=Rhodanobacter sp. DHB23 TaxID=2775923 RepID=UPI00177C431B|nr:diguanylate cyclase [Rhodanobacter sp. DHB23]MBD8874368.1 GGDEF domain-containing protein [Rhodanobacter sp. DHB23]
MLSHQAIHAVGAAVYLVFCALFLWLRTIPRTNPGAGWWAMALLFACAGHVDYLLQPVADAGAPTEAIYAALKVMESACLVAGMIRCFRLAFDLRFVALAWFAVEAWIWLGVAFGATPHSRGLTLVGVSVLVQSAIGWVALRFRDELDARWMPVASAASFLLALHWALVYPVIAWAPIWSSHGFLLGVALTLAQYFALLAALLRSFQQRLLLAESHALDMAFRDPLTGLNNRRYMNSLFENALLLATRPHHLVAVLCIDLDDFKSINDQAGHLAGDEVLKVVAERLTHATRSTDICARLGGDEFVAICTQLDQAEQAHAIARKLLDALAEPIVAAERSWAMHASIGISFYPRHGHTLTELLGHADRAMYQVKHAGKHGYRIHPEQAVAES